MEIIKETLEHEPLIAFLFVVLLLLIFIALPIAVKYRLSKSRKTQGLLRDADDLVNEGRLREAYEKYYMCLPDILDTESTVSKVCVLNPRYMLTELKKHESVIQKLKTIMIKEGVPCELHILDEVKHDLTKFIGDRSFRRPHVLQAVDPIKGEFTKEGWELGRAIAKRAQEVYANMPESLILHDPMVHVSTRTPDQPKYPVSDLESSPISFPEPPDNLASRLDSMLEAGNSITSPAASSPPPVPNTAILPSVHSRTRFEATIITAKCLNCGKSYRVREKSLGCRAKCKICGELFIIKPAIPRGE